MDTCPVRTADLSGMRLTSKNADFLGHKIFVEGWQAILISENLLEGCVGPKQELATLYTRFVKLCFYASRSFATLYAVLHVYDFAGDIVGRGVGQSRIRQDWRSVALSSAVKNAGVRFDLVGPPLDSVRSIPRILQAIAQATACNHNPDGAALGPGFGVWLTVKQEA